MKYYLSISVLALVVLSACTRSFSSVQVVTSTTTPIPPPTATSIALCTDVAADYSRTLDELATRWDDTVDDSQLDLLTLVEELRTINVEIGALRGPECTTAVGAAFYASTDSMVYAGELELRNAQDVEMQRAITYSEGLYSVYTDDMAAFLVKPVTISLDTPLPAPKPTIPALVTDPNAPCAETAELQLRHQDVLFERWGNAFQIGFDAWAKTGNATDPSGVIREFQIVQRDIDYTEQVPCLYEARQAFFMLTQASITMFTGIKEKKTQDEVIDFMKHEARWLEKYTEARQAIGPWTP